MTTRDCELPDWEKIAFERQLQATSAAQGILGTEYLHVSRAPLDTIDFSNPAQGDLFGNECEGMCGV